MITPEEMKEIAFFRNLSEPHRGQLAAMASIKKCEANAIVFRQGQDSSEIYIILNGEISLQVAEPGGESVEISRLGLGELLGWSPILGRHAMTATARAVTPCRLAVLNVPALLEFCERDPRFGMAFLREIALVVSDRLWGARRNLARVLTHRPLFASTPEPSE